MVQNAAQCAAKCKTKSINIRRNGINKTLMSHEKHGRKGQNSRKKVGFWGQKTGNWALKKTNWQPN